jgi:uncharacterized membrane protein YedE/YeeE
MHMRNVIAALVAGLVFGMGLAVSQMISPAKVIGFLDIAGNWDPSLALVMAGGVIVASFGFAIARRRAHPLFAKSFMWPTGIRIDSRLIAGGALFGTGWGIAGYCPGPAIASIGFLQPGTLLFVGAMLAGMILFEIFDRRSRA